MICVPSTRRIPASTSSSQKSGKLSHEHTMVQARAAADKLFDLLQAYIADYSA
jgi:hypothetical protein